ncbi:hypothetical protein [Filifactor villosus]|uniref:Uncharacterized protein n=1 Tax=Filifactor villosus TaxID=29374 RepID=A0ABV9QKJ3_9FIRM
MEITCGFVVAGYHFADGQDVRDHTSVCRRDLILTKDDVVPPMRYSRETNKHEKRE